MHCSLKKAWFLHEKERHTVLQYSRTVLTSRGNSNEVVCSSTGARGAILSLEESSCFHSKVHVGWGVIPVVVLEGFRS